MNSSRQEKYKVIIKFFPIRLLQSIFFVCIFDRIAHSTSCSLIQLLKSHSREIRESMAVQVNATGGSSSLMEMNAVDQ